MAATRQKEEKPIETPKPPELWKLIPMTDRLKWWIALFGRIDKVRFANAAPGVEFKEDGVYVRATNRYDAQRFGFTEFGVYRFTDKVELYIGEEKI